ncbi:hypothetical protein HK103_007109 [Boothiomyces macroporosus]|uniref:GH18 domain-containing protein n=1 Tax=Boothiomyces macroporosus TaxID=261099 RepID=A0AAD5Y673_9FUNG|nr:hypothetical protein HK103_007109 [Boothiomyces macroporosus]
MQSLQENWNSGKKLIVYHTNWACYGRNFQVKDLPVNYISDINYSFLDLKPNAQGFYVPAFSDPWSDVDKRYGDPKESVQPLDHQQPANPGEYFGNLGQFMKLKRAGYKFNLGLSIGGWSFSTHFSEAVATPESRLAFVNACMEILNRFPGLISRLDFDWEHISPPGANYGKEGNSTSPNDGNSLFRLGPNFGMLLELLRNHLDHSPFSNVTITACVTGDPNAMSALPISVMGRVLESINIMSYDMACSSYGQCLAGHHTNLYSTHYSQMSIDQAVKKYISLGIPREKIVIGAALYSRGFANTDGLGKPSFGIVDDRSWEDGVCDYKTLPRPGAAEYYDEAAQAHYSYDPNRRILNSYDSVRSIKAKCDYVWKEGLKGVIVWESAGDYPISDPRSLLATLYHGLVNKP